MIQARLKDRIQEAKIAAGIITQKAMTGPWTVQIDINNSCNNDCVGCWCHSPLLGELAMDAETKKKFLPYKLVLKLIDDLDDLGVRDIYFTGGGEPFLHPNAVDIMVYVKKKGMRCDMSNNFTMLNEEKMKRLAVAGVDNMNCSIWAGSEEAYLKTHPNKSKGDFSKVEEKFKLFYEVKKRLGKTKPTLNIYNVISSMNYDDFDNMIEFAFRCKVDGVDFTPTDIVPGKTDSLMLTKEQREHLSEKARNIWPKFYDWSARYGHKIIIRNYDQFLRRLSSDDTENGVYDKSIIGTIPCYAGYTFLRILADGSVNSCLKAIRIPIGNIYEKSIKDIWKGNLQEKFRKHTLNYDVKDPYFYNIGNKFQHGVNGCLLCCDNLGLNLAVHGKLGKIPLLAKKMSARLPSNK
ncbi:MAG: radical SAM protein [Candidatus Woesearchaeota archaeon]|nr:radical SAM protein [Candidatus Woesearchaeota archaeon]